MKLSEVQTNQFCKLNSLVMFKLPNGEFDCALPGEKLKSGKMTVDVTVEEATKEEFIQAVNSANHQNDWYSLLLKDLMLDRMKSL